MIFSCFFSLMILSYFFPSWFSHVFFSSWFSHVLFFSWFSQVFSCLYYPKKASICFPFHILVAPHLLLPLSDYFLLMFDNSIPHILPQASHHFYSSAPCSKEYYFNILKLPQGQDDSVVSWILTLTASHRSAVNGLLGKW